MLNKQISIGDYLGEFILNKTAMVAGLTNEQRLYYAPRPVEFAEEILGVSLWSKQREILNSLVDHPTGRVTVRSAHGVGKTFTAALAVLWFISCYVPSSVVTTAPTQRQVKSILWEEIHKLYRGAKTPLGGRLLQMELQMGAKWFATGFATDEYNVDRFQGYHNESILVVVDEAAGVSRGIYEGIEGLLSAGNAKLLLIGNPNDELTEFGKSFKSNLYKKIHISAFDTPNLREGHIKYPYLVSPQWVEERRIAWGESDPLYIVRVLGNFPSASEGALITLGQIEKAKMTKVTPEGVKTLGVDIARFGGDESVAFLRHGDCVIGMYVWLGNDLMQSTGKIAQIINEEIPERINIDSVGIGAGVVDRLLELGYDVTGINGSERAYNVDRYVNMRTEMAFNLKSRFETGNIRIPDDDKLTHQLVNIKQGPLTSRGQIKLETKESMKARIGSSPDRADALMLAFYERIGGRTQNLGSIQEMFQPGAEASEHKLVKAFETIKNPISNPLNLLYNLPRIEEDECPHCGRTGRGIIAWGSGSGNALGKKGATKGLCLLCNYKWEIGKEEQ